MMRRFVDVILGSILVIFVASVAWAAQTGQQAARSGTAADFAVAFPWLVVGLVTALFAIIAWFAQRYDTQREKKIDQAIKEIAKTNVSMAAATNKLDATINTLFERDRDMERTLSTHAQALASMRATCEARGRMCPVLDGKIVCLDRRDGEDRREEG